MDCQVPPPTSPLPILRLLSRLLGLRRSAVACVAARRLPAAPPPPRGHPWRSMAAMALARRLPGLASSIPPWMLSLIHI
eukprot:14140166-Alexandrium_andersonii.AAC.1